MIAAVAVVGGGAWLLGLAVGAILGVVATLTVGTAPTSPARSGSRQPRRRSTSSPGCRTTTSSSRTCSEAVAGGNDRVRRCTCSRSTASRNTTMPTATRDALLEWLARKLRDAVGSYGSVYRMRGGSFALLAVGSDEVQERAVRIGGKRAQRERRRVRTRPRRRPGGTACGGAVAGRGARARRSSRRQARLRASREVRPSRAGRHVPGAAARALSRHVATLATGVARRLGVPEAES